MKTTRERQVTALKLILGNLRSLSKYRNDPEQFEARLYQIQRKVATEIGRLQGKLQVRHGDMEEYGRND